MDDSTLERRIWEAIWSPTIVKTPQRKVLVLKIKALILEDRKLRINDA